MYARFGCLSVLPWILFAQMSWDLSAVPVVAASVEPYEVPPEVNDPADLFSGGVKRESRRTVRRIRSKHRALIMVETVKSLDGEAIDDVALRRAQRLGPKGVYILIVGTGQDRDVAVAPGRSKPAGLLSDPDRAAIREAFLGPLRSGNADGALERGLQMIESTLARTAASRPKASLQEAVLPLTIFSTLLVVLVALQVGAGDEGVSQHAQRPAPLGHDAVLPSRG